jgi:hypothetical protein
MNLDWTTHGHTSTPEYNAKSPILIQRDCQRQLGCGFGI